MTGLKAEVKECMFGHDVIFVMQSCYHDNTVAYWGASTLEEVNELKSYKGADMGVWQPKGTKELNKLIS